MNHTKKIGLSLVLLALITAGVTGIPSSHAQNRTAVIILAAGEGTRMKTPDRPKTLTPVAGQPMLYHILHKILSQPSHPEVAIIVGYLKEKVQQAVSTDFASETTSGQISFITQDRQWGTGHAVKVAMESDWGARQIDRSADILVLAGDMPLLSFSLIETMLAPLPQSAKMRLLTTRFETAKGYGRVVRNKEGSITRIVEQKDAIREMQDAEAQGKEIENLLAIQEVNVSVYLFRAQFLQEKIQELRVSPVTGEYYLPEMIEIAVQGAKPGEEPVASLVWQNNSDLVGVNDPTERAQAEEIMDHRERN